MPYRSGPHLALLPDPSGGDPEAVRFERHGRNPEGQACDRVGDVVAHPGQLPKFLHGRGQLSSVVRGEQDRGLPEVTGPCVVPRAFPHLEDVELGGARERSDGGERPQEPFEVGDRLGDPGLLEEDLSDPDVVRIPSSTPGQGSTMRSEPGEKGRSEGRREDRGTHGVGARSHGVPASARAACLKRGGFWNATGGVLRRPNRARRSR